MAGQLRAAGLSRSLPRPVPLPAAERVQGTKVSRQPCITLQHDECAYSTRLGRFWESLFAGLAYRCRTRSDEAPTFDDASVPPTATPGKAYRVPRLRQGRGVGRRPKVATVPEQSHTSSGPGEVWDHRGPGIRAHMHRRSGAETLPSCKWIAEPCRFGQASSRTPERAY